MDKVIDVNRKERRRAGITTNVKTYTLNETQIQELKQEATREAVEQAMITVLYSSIMVLRDSGFGKKRLERFVEDWFELFDSIQKDYLDFDDMIQTIKEETGFEIKRQ